MSDEQKNTADIEAQENKTVDTTDELTNEELDEVAGGRQNMQSASTNPLYTDRGLAGNNPLYTSK